MGIGAAVGGLASLGGGLLKSGAASSASGAQAQAAMMAAMLQMQMFQQTQANEAPFISAGKDAIGAVQAMTGTNPGGNPLTAPLTSRFMPTMEQLAATPGYQFTLDQGLKATQNSFAAKGLGTSGPALRGAADYASGLASQTYQQQFGNYWAQNRDIYNMLAGQGQLGANVAVGQGNQGIQVGANVGSNLISGGNAQANGILGSANALTGGINNAIGYGMMGAGTPQGSLFSQGGNWLTNAWNGGGESVGNTMANYPGSGFDTWSIPPSQW